MRARRACLRKKPPQGDPARILAADCDEGGRLRTVRLDTASGESVIGIADPASHRG